MLSPRAHFYKKNLLDLIKIYSKKIKHSVLFIPLPTITIQAIYLYFHLKFTEIARFIAPSFGLITSTNEVLRQICPCVTFTREFLNLIAPPVLFLTYCNCDGIKDR